MNLKELKFIYEGGAVSRFHTATLIKPCTVAEHSFGVALLALRLGGSPACIEYCLKHDLAEQAVGDIPSPSKRRFGISEQLEAYENEVLAEAGVDMPTLSFEDHRIFKLADCFDGMMTCVRERRLGNKTVGIIFNRYLSYVDELGTPSSVLNKTRSAVIALWMEANS